MACTLGRELQVETEFGDAVSRTIYLLPSSFRKALLVLVIFSEKEAYKKAKKREKGHRIGIFY